MTTKYIVDNLSGQTITGNVTINGNLSVTGVTTGSLLTYSALLTQIGSQTGVNINDFNGAFIIGETYTISNYVNGDDFSNVANVTSGIINQTNCVFIATGQTPTNWSNGSTLVSSGNLVVTVLENNLGYDLHWEMNPFGSSGIYMAFNNTLGPIYNNFNRIKTSINTQLTTFGPPIPIQLFSIPSSLSTKDDVIIIGVWDFDLGAPVDNSLYYTPVQINIKQDTDTTPIIISGITTASFPFNYVSVRLLCNNNYVENFVGNNTTVNNVEEMITQLNTDPTTNYLGTYSDDGSGGVLLSIPTNLVNQFCSNGTLTFEVFND